MENYPWAANRNKLVRAFAEATEKTEEAIKARYEAIGGLLVITNQKIMNEEEETKVEGGEESGTENVESESTGSGTQESSENNGGETNETQADAQDDASADMSESTDEQTV